MKIAWVTPFCRASAVGRFSQTVTAELARHAVVDVWTANEEDLHATNLKVVPLALLDREPDALAAYDHVVYNLGDSWPYHGEIFKHLERTPGIVLLHDYVMHHFFKTYYFGDQRDPERYLQKIEELYGGIARQEVQEGFAAGRDVDAGDRVIDYPFFEPCLARATAAIALSTFFARAVEKRALCPVGRLFLPHHEYDRAVPLKANKTALGVPRDKLLLLTVGVVNANKRIDAVLDVLGQDARLAAKVHYVVIGRPGQTAYWEKLEYLLRYYRLDKVVRLLGPQSDEVLYQYLSSADLCINLRNPAMEGSSSSLVEALYFARPLLVSDTGCYQEVPDSCVAKIPVENEVTCLGEVLPDLVADEARRRTLGRQGREYVTETRSPARFARDFLRFAETINSTRLPQLDLIDRVSRELAAMDVRSGTDLIKRISKEIDTLWPHGASVREEERASLPVQLGDCRRR